MVSCFVPGLDPAQKEPGAMTQDPYVLFTQCNLWKSPNASTELGLYLNKAMTYYRYIDKDRAGFYLDSDGQKEAPDDRYKKRLANVGIQIDDNDNIVSKPSESERQGFKASHKKGQSHKVKNFTFCVKNGFFGQALILLSICQKDASVSGFPPSGS